jgi:hypothetical protein
MAPNNGAAMAPNNAVICILPLMDIQHLLGRLEAVLTESKKVPGMRLKLVDTERCFQLIDQMMMAIPEEIKKAQRVMQEHERIIAQAKEEAERIRELARDEALRLADDSSITQIAQNRAAAIEERARKEVDRLRNDADAYTIDTLQRFKDELEHTLQVVSNGLDRLENDRAARRGLNDRTDE